MTRHVLAWGLAVSLGVGIASVTGPAASMPDAVRIPIVQPHPGGIPPDAALFRHATHGQLVCYACHPGLFERRRVGFTHAQMQAGAFCGSCHDGRTAFGIPDRPCDACHVPK